MNYHLNSLSYKLGMQGLKYVLTSLKNFLTVEQSAILNRKTILIAVPLTLHSLSETLQFMTGSLPHSKSNRAWNTNVSVFKLLLSLIITSARGSIKIYRP